MKYPTVLSFGAPDSNKGTQVKILEAVTHFYHDEPTVNLWRDFIHQTYKIGRLPNGILQHAVKL